MNPKKASNNTGAKTSLTPPLSLFSVELCNIADCLMDSEFGLPRSLYRSQDQKFFVLTFTNYIRKPKFKRLREMLGKVLPIADGILKMKKESEVLSSGDLKLS